MLIFLLGKERRGRPLIIKKFIARQHEFFKLNPKLTTFQYIPKKPISLILGDNGSGKSALLSLLLPRTIEMSELGEGGVVQLVLEHEGQEYTLTTRKGYGHSFKVGDTELNPGRGIKIQGALIEQHLKMTKKLHGILTGSLAFSTLPVAQRRDLIESLSGHDYRLLNALHKKIRSQALSSKTLIKHLSEELVKKEKQLQEYEAAKDVDVEAWQSAVDRLSAKIRSVRTIDKEATLNTLSTLERMIKNYYPKRIAWRDHAYTKLGSTDPERLHVRIRYLENKRLALQTENDGISKRLGELENLPTMAYDDAVNRASVLEQDIRILSDQLTEDKKHLGITEVPVLPQDLMEMAGGLDEMIGALRVYKSKADLDRHIEHHQQRLESLHREIATIRADKEHHVQVLNQDHDTHTCSQCGYVDNNESLREEARQAIRQATTQEEQLLSTLKAVKEKYHAMQSLAKMYEDRRRSLLSIRHQYIHDSLDQILFSHHPKYHQCFTYLYELDKLAKQQLVLNESIEEQQRIKQSLSLYQHLTKGVSPKEEKTSLEDKLRVNHNAIFRLNDEIERLKDALSRYDRMVKQKDQIDTLYSEVCKDITGRKIGTANDALLVTLRALRNKIDENLYQKVNIEHLTKSVQRDKEQIQTLEDDHTNASRLERILSPKGTLVGGSIYGYINSLFSQMNHYLDQVWGYPLEMCLLEDGSSLSYRFPVSIDGQIRSDISKANTAAQNIIDLVFRIVAMQQLGLGEYPFYIDEFGMGYDAVHTEKLCTMIEEHALTLGFSRWFIVAQSAEVYDRFSSQVSERVILSDTHLKRLQKGGIAKGFKTEILD
jgi:DNA repair exonuclease SbcCD ATPase subunit